MIKEHLNKDGSLDMRHAENQHYVARNWKRSLLLAVILGAIIACALVTFISRPRVASQPIFNPVEVKEGYINHNYPENFYEHKVLPTSTPAPKSVVKVAYAREYTYEQHANKPYYDDIIAELRMRYVNWQDAAELIGRECGFDPGAINSRSGACGLAQALPCTKMGCSLSDINCQLDWQWDYIAGRYGTISKALQFWYANKYY